MNYTPSGPRGRVLKATPGQPQPPTSPEDIASHLFPEDLTELQRGPEYEPAPVDDVIPEEDKDNLADELERLGNGQG